MTLDICLEQQDPLPVPRCNNYFVAVEGSGLLIISKRVNGRWKHGKFDGARMQGRYLHLHCWYQCCRVTTVSGTSNLVSCNCLLTLRPGCLGNFESSPPDLAKAALDLAYAAAVKAYTQPLSKWPHCSYFRALPVPCLTERKIQRQRTVQTKQAELHPPRRTDKWSSSSRHAESSSI